MYVLPGFQRAVTPQLACLQIAVGKIQIPVRIFHVAHKVPYAAFEVGQRKVRTNSCNHHAVDRIDCSRGILVE